MTKKDFFKSSFVLLGAGLMGFASCTNEDENSVTPDEKGLIPVEIRSGISGGRTELDGDGKTVKFQSGDKLAVWDADKHEFTTTGSGSMAVFKGTLNASTPTGQTLNILYPYSAGKDCDGTTITATIPATQTATENTFDPSANLSVATADYTKGQNVTCTLQNVCGLLKFTIANDAPEDSYDSIRIAGKNGENIAGTVTINPSAENPAATGGNAKTITLKGALTKGCTYCIALMPQTFTADGLVMTFYKGTDNVGEAKIVKKDGSALKISPGVILNAGEVKPVKPEPKPTGKFTVAVNGTDTTKVSFAPGNMIYDVNNSKWGFFENQYDYDTSYSSDLISLFTWGYGDWSTNPSTTNYGTSFKDWGTQIGDGKTWRTLSTDEWDYLLNARTMPNGKPRYTNNAGSGFKIEGKSASGLFIYPDGYNGALIGNGGPSTWDAINSAGIVFLPCAGYRSGSTVGGGGSYGYYWSASANDVSRAYYVFFGSGNVLPQDSYYRYSGQAVRLVCASE